MYRRRNVEYFISHPHHQASSSKTADILEFQILRMLFEIHIYGTT